MTPQRSAAAAHCMRLTAARPRPQPCGPQRARTLLCRGNRRRQQRAQQPRRRLGGHRARRREARQPAHQQAHAVAPDAARRERRSTLLRGLLDERVAPLRLVEPRQRCETGRAAVEQGCMGRQQGRGAADKARWAWGGPGMRQAAQAPGNAHCAASAAHPLQAPGGSSWWTRRTRPPPQAHPAAGAGEGAVVGTGSRATEHRCMPRCNAAARCAARRLPCFLTCGMLLLAARRRACAAFMMLSSTVS